MDPAPPLEFGPLLKQYRLKAGLSQEILAERSGVSVDAISALERGARHAPRAETIALLVTACCCRRGAPDDALADAAETPIPMPTA